MRDTEIMLVENILKKHNIKNSNELSARLNEMENDKSIIRGLQKALNQRDKSISKKVDKISMLRTTTNKKSVEIKSTKSLALNDKLKLLNEIKLKDHKNAVLERALELACEIAVGNPRMNCSTIKCQDECMYGQCHSLSDVKTYFIDQAKNELKDGDID